MTWLITGGAGYVGSHVVKAFREAGLTVVVLDDLSSGFGDRVPVDVPMVVGSVLDYDLVQKTIKRHHVSGVVHIAGRKMVNESHQRPLYYYRENVGGFQSLLNCITESGIRRVVFSSSAAVYGHPKDNPIPESASTVPLSPYGHSKLYCEQILRDVAKVSGINWITLRYFNVAGAADESLIDSNTANLIPIVLQALREGRRPEIHGAAHPTPDGTPVRDFIHVADLADAHLKAAQHLDGKNCQSVYNIGSGTGVSVRTVIENLAQLTGTEVSPLIIAPREHDASSIVADVSLIARELGWRPRLGISEMIASSWTAQPIA